MDRRLPQEIKAIRDRLAEVERERTTLADSDFERRDELLDEEQDLEARLTHLVETAGSDRDGEAERTVAEHTDLTRSPRLPDAGVNS